MLYGVGFKSANLLKVSLVSATAMLAICLLALVETTNPAEADDSRLHNGKIAFSYTIGYKTGDYSDIYTVNPDGTGLTNLTSETGTSVSERSPAWSPDGTKIAFASYLGRDAIHYEIYVIDVNGRNLKRHTHTPGTAWEPNWQPLPTPPKGRSETVHPPDTGGPSLLLVASALLFSVGVLLFAVVKRRM